MITITEAFVASGYSGCDHLLTGRECDDVIGRQFRSVGEACQAADSAAERNGDRRAVGGGPHCRVTCRMASGETVVRTT